MTLQDTALSVVTETATVLLERTYLGNPVRAWAMALAVAAATLGVLLVARHFLVGRLERLSARTTTRIDDYAAALLRRTRLFFIVTVSLAAGLAFLRLPGDSRALLYQLARLAAIVQLGLWANELIAIYLRRLIAEKSATDVASVTTINALAVVTRLVLWVVVFLVALANFGVDVTALITGLGIAGVAVALAVQNILGDLLASMSIVLDKPFVVGETIMIGEHVATVEEVGLKTTRLRRVSGEQLIISNADLLKSQIRNFGRMPERRVVLNFGVEYGTPKATLARIPDDVRAIVAGVEMTRFDRAHFTGFGPSSLDFEVVYFVLTGDYLTFMNVQQAVNLAVYEHVGSLGAAFAFPTQTLVLRRDQAASDGGGHDGGDAAAVLSGDARDADRTPVGTPSAGAGPRA